MARYRKRLVEIDAFQMTRERRGESLAWLSEDTPSPGCSQLQSKMEPEKNFPKQDQAPRMVMSSQKGFGQFGLNTPTAEKEKAREERA